MTGTRDLMAIALSSRVSRGEGCPVLGFLSCEFHVLFLKSNSLLVSGHLPFLLCPWSDVIPNP